MQTNNTTLAMQLRQATDAQSGLVAYTYLAPEGWEIEDRVQWNQYDLYHPAQLFAHCFDRNGLTFQVHAGYTNSYWANPMGNSGNFPPNDITDVLKRHLEWFRGTNIHFTEATVLSSAQQPGIPGFNARIFNQYGRVRGTYEKNGYKFDEILYGSMTLTHMQQPPDFTGFYYEDITWDVSNLFVSCASGNRDPETGVAGGFAVSSSVRKTQAFHDYEQQVISIYRQKVKQQKEAAKETHKIITDTNREINEMYEDTRRKQEITRDKQHEQFCDYIRDVDRYTDGKGTEYMLPTGYQSAWVSSLGKVVLADSGVREPYLYDTSYETWTKLDRKKY